MKGRNMKMLRAATVTAGASLIATIALAVGDIPTRYSGSFPSDGLRTDITGTFTGKTLSVKFTRVQHNRPFRRSFAGSCTNTSSTQTRCVGRIQGSGTDDLNAPAEVIVTWSAGKPTAIAFSK
jgi:hypothetical protein